MIRYLVRSGFFCFFMALTAKAQHAQIKFETDFTEPKVFIDLPDFKNINLRDIAISPDNDEVFFTLDAPKYAYRAILTSKKMNGKWGAFEVAAFSGKYKDIEPAFSPDGNVLFFVSTRPALEGEEEKQDYDIWKVERTGTGWGAPIRLPEIINTAGNEYYPSVSANGSLYFTSEREGSLGKEDIFISEWSNGQYSLPESVNGMNTEGYEYNAYIAPDESYMIFGNYGNKKTLGKGDLYISFKKNGLWQTPQWLGESLNSVQLDYCPFVTTDGKYFFFTSERSNINNNNRRLSYDELTRELNKPENGVSRIYYLPFKQVLKSVVNE